MRDFMAALDARGDLIHVYREVDPKHELAAVTQAAIKLGKPLLFHNVKGTRFPVLTSIYATRERIAEVLGIEARDFCREWSKLANTPKLGDASLLPETSPPASDYFDCKLSDLPLLTYSERDGAPYFTSAMFYAKEPETGVGNLSFHRSMYISDRELRCRLAPRHHLTLYHEKAEKMGKYLEAAMLIGPPATSFLTAAAPIPYDEDELDVAARLAGKPIPLRRCKHIDLWVPAGTEIVIEGRFLPNERRAEGPFGEFMGYYVPVGNNAVFEVLGVTCQPFVLHSVVKIQQQYEGHARQVLLAVMGAEPTWAKMVTVVDEDVDIYNMDDVMWAILTRSRPDKDFITIPDTPTFYRDPNKDHWGRMGIDATAPFARRDEFVRKRIPGATTVDLSQYIETSPK